MRYTTFRTPEALKITGQRANARQALLMTGMASGGLRVGLECCRVDVHLLKLVRPAGHYGLLARTRGV